MHTQQECTCFDDWKVSDVIFNHKSDSRLHAYIQHFKILLQASGNELIRRASKRSELCHSCSFCFGDAKNLMWLMWESSPGPLVVPWCLLERCRLCKRDRATAQMFWYASLEVTVTNNSSEKTGADQNCFTHWKRDGCALCSLNLRLMLLLWQNKHYQRLKDLAFLNTISIFT